MAIAAIGRVLESRELAFAYLIRASEGALASVDSIGLTFGVIRLSVGLKVGLRVGLTRDGTCRPLDQEQIR